MLLSIGEIPTQQEQVDEGVTLFFFIFFTDDRTFSESWGGFFQYLVQKLPEK